MKRWLLILIVLCSCSSINYGKVRSEKEAKKDRKAFVISVAVFGVWLLCFKEFGE
jgi:hypothetical protein